MSQAAVQAPPSDAAPPAMQDAVVATGLRRWLTWKSLVIALCVVFTLYIAVMPLGFLLWQSFFTPQTATKAAEFTFGNYLTAYTSSDTARLFWTSVQFAIGTATFAFVVGTTLAWMNERTNTPFKRLFFAMSLIPLVIPGILFTVAWILLGSPKIGLVNLLLMKVFSLQDPVFNIYSMWGMIWVDGLHYSPVAFLLMTAVCEHRVAPRRPLEPQRVPVPRAERELGARFDVKAFHDQVLNRRNLGLIDGFFAPQIAFTYCSSTSSAGPRQCGSTTGQSFICCHWFPQMLTGVPNRANSAINGPRSSNAVPTNATSDCHRASTGPRGACARSRRTELRCRARWASV